MVTDLNVIFFAIVGLSFLALFSMAGFGIFYLAILSILFLAAAAGLFLKRKEGLILGMLLLPMGFVFGSVILYASLAASGSSIALVVLSIIYIGASLFFALKLIKNREKYIGSKA